MVDAEKRKLYMREYRKKNKEKMKAYNAAWLANPENAAKHKEACRKYHLKTDTEEKRAKNREYQKQYYRRKKMEQKLW